MPNKDTRELLKECNSGSKMAVDAIDEILPHVRDKRMSRIMTESRRRHEALGDKLHRQLSHSGQQTEDPPMMATAMSHLQIGVKMALDPTDHQAASLLLDGCNMGVKTISQQLNRYPAASEEARTAAAELVDIEQRLADDMKQFL